MRTIRITGTGSALPGRIVTNKELEQLVETSDEWIRERTGIAERHVSVGETVVTLASEAARKALEQAGKMSGRDRPDSGGNLLSGAVSALLRLSGAGGHRRSECTGF